MGGGKGLRLINHFDSNGRTFLRAFITIFTLLLENRLTGVGEQSEQGGGAQLVYVYRMS